MTTTRSLFLKIDEDVIERYCCTNRRCAVFVLFLLNHKDEGPVTVLEEPSSALEFLRDYVSLGRPLVIRKAVSFCCTVSG
ncbi:hypothetical protein FisN_5Lu066 [Fistulifera solaris]|uniref:Uncharacterized protein n=1 Tax=Fistulifera solaris TaxID=1519565 RepID=A0A1Z5JJ57_FISSO|nr:hypothetical protein FisN_5Lu066 [Fistulifera solaris]|eukprot:GAX14024.1 hypothetical protein FisN_5Lu066 [Fistulifera solaris]